jgi:hypothetical protein
MTFLERILAWFEAEPDKAPSLPPSAPLTPDPTLSALTPAAPALEAQRYSDANYAVSRQLETRKRHAMTRICDVNNAAAEDVIDRKGTTVRPSRLSRAAAPLTAAEQHDAINLAEVVFAAENDHDPRQ